MASEIESLRKALMPAIWVFLAVFLFLVAFKIEHIIAWGLSLFFPIPALDSISLSIFNKIQHDLLPQGIKILVTDPVHALLVQIDISLFFAFIVSLPILLFQTVKYVSPALKDNERELLSKLALPTGGLFLLGCVMGYYFIVPSILKLLNSYTTVLNAATYFEINKFISFVLLFTFLSGIAFTLPILMKLLVKLGIDKRFFLKNFKFALIFVLAISFVIAPDLTTMFIVSAMMMSLYLFGYYLS